MTEAFVPVADNCSYTQTQPDAKGEFFRLVAEQGHYGGRTKPTATRQGLYACTAEGELLTSINTREADGVLEMMQQALDKWHQRPIFSTQRNVPESYEPAPGYRWEYPDGGLILKVSVRDLPRESPVTELPNAKGEANAQHNLDYAWFTKTEASAMVPPEIQAGQSYPAPEIFVQRIARFHLVDTVRGESPRLGAEDVKKAEMTLTVKSATADQVNLRIEGEVRNEAHPSFDVNPFSGQAVDKGRGVDLRLLGYLHYDRQQKEFDRFDMIAVGQRWGATTYNGRFDDLGPAPIGFAFELAPNSPIDRTPPQAIRSDYFGV